MQSRKESENSKFYNLYLCKTVQNPGILLLRLHDFESDSVARMLAGIWKKFESMSYHEFLLRTIGLIELEDGNIPPNPSI